MIPLQIMTHLTPSKPMSLTDIKLPPMPSNDLTLVSWQITEGKTAKGRFLIFEADSYRDCIAMDVSRYCCRFTKDLSYETAVYGCYIEVDYELLGEVLRNC